VLKGRRSAAYPALESDVKAAGATYVDSEAVADGQMVSARAWPDHPSWMREFIRLLQKKAPVAAKEAAGVR
jgi:protease I